MKPMHLARNHTVIRIISRGVRYCARKVQHTERQDESIGHDDGSPTEVKCDNHKDEVDFFGFLRGEGVKDVATVTTDSLNSSSSHVDFDEITRSEKQQNEDKLYITNFGKIRYDIDNMPQYHGEFDEHFNKSSQSDAQHSLYACESWNVFAGDVMPNKTLGDSTFNPKIRNESIISERKSSETPHASDYIDNQYLDSPQNSKEIKSDYSHSSNVNETPNLGPKAKHSLSESSQNDYQATTKNVFQSHFIEDQYFSNEEAEVKSYGESKCQLSSVDDIPIINPGVKLMTADESSNVFDRQYFATAMNEKIDDNIETHESFERRTEVHKPVTKYEQKRINYKPPDIEDPKTAYDYVMKLRNEKKLNGM